MIQRPHTRAFAVLAAASVFVVACIGGAPTNAPTAEAATVAPPTLPPRTLAPATQAPASIGPSFTLPSVDKELEALLPDELGGETVSKSSVGGAALLAGPGGDDYQRMLTALGKSPSDLSAAIGGTTKLIILAFRIKGVEANVFFDAYIDAAVAQPQAQLTDITIAGKAAKRFTDAGSTLYIYFVEGASITVSLFEPDAALLTEIFKELP